MHEQYATQGIAVFAFDQRGFGRTALEAEEQMGKPGALYGKTGWNAQLCDMEHWVKHVKNRYPTHPVFLMGHSMVSALFPEVR